MSRRDRLPPGVPCFVDTLTPDADAASRFYGGIFGGSSPGPGADPGRSSGDYFVARVAGETWPGSAPAGADPAPPPRPPGTPTCSSQRRRRGRAGGGGGRHGPGGAVRRPAGRAAGRVADPAGASICLWEAGERSGRRADQRGVGLGDEPAQHRPTPKARCASTASCSAGRRTRSRPVRAWRLALAAGPATSAASPSSRSRATWWRQMRLDRTSGGQPAELERGFLDRRRRGGRRRGAATRRRRGRRAQDVAMFRRAVLAARTAQHSPVPSHADARRLDARRRDRRRESDRRQHSAGGRARRRAAPPARPRSRGQARWEAANASSPATVSSTAPLRRPSAQPDRDAGQSARRQHHPAERARPGRHAPPRSRRSDRRRRSARWDPLGGSQGSSPRPRRDDPHGRAGPLALGVRRPRVAPRRVTEPPRRGDQMGFDQYHEPLTSCRPRRARSRACAPR